MSEPGERPKYPAERATLVASEICEALAPAVERLLVAGSLRRGKVLVGDVEILYIPRVVEEKDPENFFGSVLVNQADVVLAQLEAGGVLVRRTNGVRRLSYGPKNKFMRHVQSGVPVDLFSTTAECWFNYLVCRTGPAESNIRICRAAEARGWVWNPYGVGFKRGSEVRAMESERDVFEFVGLEYAEPELRV